MKPNYSVLILIPLFLSIWNVSYGQSIISLEGERQLFIDHYLVASLNNTKLQLHDPQDEGPVLDFDKPWEGAFSFYSTIIKDENKYRAYYRGWPSVNEDTQVVTAYAESKDGIHWEKPDLQIYEINGTYDNNVILADEGSVTHNFSPFLDTNPKAKPEQRYKAVGGTGESGLIAFVSPDGIHWEKLQEEPVITEGVFDSQNVVFWSESEKQYVSYFRTWTEGGYDGIRSVSRTTSDDFIHWSEPREMTFGDMPMDHIYVQQTSPYYRAPQIYVALAARFMPGRQVISKRKAKSIGVAGDYYKDISDAVLMTSRGGNHYDRTFMQSFIRPGIGAENWVSRTNYPALNIVQTSPEEMSIYVNRNYTQPTAHLSRYTLRLDGFASLSAGYLGGEMLTKPFTFTGKELEINYSTSVAGNIKIEIQDRNGNAIPGFTLDDSQEIIGDEIKRIVTWNGEKDVSDLAGKPVRLRIQMKDADLYSFKFNN